ncbi:hypothetical protein RJT34_15417 [Clitoria ternatea]|uniref:Uncharacterized protein n=1 Tax=Clitoria ternatea TaxID=43366 RepID=A0AAN9PBY9_CLITE
MLNPKLCMNEKVNLESKNGFSAIQKKPELLVWLVMLRISTAILVLRAVKDRESEDVEEISFEDDKSLVEDDRDRGIGVKSDRVWYPEEKVVVVVVVVVKDELVGLGFVSNLSSVGRRNVKTKSNTLSLSFEVVD